MSASQQIIVDCGAAHVSIGVFSMGKAQVAGSARRAEVSNIGGAAVGSTVRLLAYAREDFVSAPEHRAAWAAQVAAAIEALLLRPSLSQIIPLGSDCVLCLPGHLVLSKRLRTPAVLREQRAPALRFAAAQHIPFPLEQVAWAARELGESAGELDLLLAAARLDALEPLCAAIEAAGLCPSACEAAVLALPRALGATLAAAPALPGPTLYVDIGARSTQLIFLQGESPGNAFQRTLTWGGNALTTALAQALRCDFPTAEALKRRGAGEAGTAAEAAEHSLEASAEAAAALQNASTEFAQKLAAELRLTQLSYLREWGGEAPHALCVCGGASALPGLREALSTALGLPLLALPEPAALGCAGALPPCAAQASDWLTLWGAALGSGQPAARRLDLLPEARCAQVAARRRRPWCFAVAALLVLSPAPLLYWQRAESRQVRAQSEAVDLATAPLRQLSQSNAAMQAQLLELQARLEQMHTLNVHRRSWLSFLAELEASLGQAGDVWLEWLEYQPATHSGGGAAPPQGAGRAPSTPPLAEGLARAGGRVQIGGWLLDRGRADEAVQRLFEELPRPGFVQKVASERYDRSRAGLLHFEAELHLEPDSPL